MNNDISSSLYAATVATVEVPHEPIATTMTTEETPRKSRTKTQSILDNLASRNANEPQSDVRYRVAIPPEAGIEQDSTGRWNAVPPLDPFEQMDETSLASINSIEMAEQSEALSSPWKKVKHAAAHPLDTMRGKKTVKKEPNVTPHADSTSHAEVHPRKHKPGLLKRGLNKLAHPSTMFQNKPSKPTHHAKASIAKHSKEPASETTHGHVVTDNLSAHHHSQGSLRNRSHHAGMAEAEQKSYPLPLPSDGLEKPTVQHVRSATEKKALPLPLPSDAPEKGTTRHHQSTTKQEAHPLPLPPGSDTSRPLSSASIKEIGKAPPLSNSEHQSGKGSVIPNNLINEAHLEKHPHPLLASKSTDWFGLSRTTKPSAGMSLKKTGYALTSATTTQPVAPGLTAPQTGPKMPTHHQTTINKAGQKQVRLVAQGPQPKIDKSSYSSSMRHVSRMIGPATDLHALKKYTNAAFIKTPHKSAVDNLMATINDVLARSEATQSPAKQTTFPLTRRLLITELLSQVTSGNAQLALNAFHALSSGGFLPTAESYHRSHVPSDIAYARGDALSVASLLASSEDGFEALMSAMERAPRRADHRDVRRFLQAVAQVQREQGKPVDINEYGKHMSKVEMHGATLAQKVLHLQTAALQGTRRVADWTPAEMTDVFSWNQGYRSDGAGSTLNDVQERLAKFVYKYVPRAAKNHKRDKQSVDIHKPGSVFNYANAKIHKTSTRFQQVFSTKKSPLSNFAVYGVNNALLMHPEDDALILDTNAGIAIRALLTHLEGRTHGMSLPWKASAKVPLDVERAAIMQHWAELIKVSRPLGHTLNKQDVHAIARRIFASHATPGDNLSLTEKKLSHLIGHKLTLGDLEQWAKESDLPMLRLTRTGARSHLAAEAGTAFKSFKIDAPEALRRAGIGHRSEVDRDPPTDFTETAFGAAWRKAVAVDKSTQLPKDLTPDGLHRYFRTFYEESNLGNFATASNGGMFGFSTGVLSVGIEEASKVFTLLHTGVPIGGAPIADGRLSRSNNAFVNIGSTTHGFEMFIGTQKPFSASLALGASGSVGVPFDVNHGKQSILPKGALSAFIKPSYDSIRTQGAMIRTLRDESADGTKLDSPVARQLMVDVVDLLFQIPKQSGKQLSRAEIWQKIAVQFFDSPRLSIGWQDQTASFNRFATGGAAQVSMGLSGKDRTQAGLLGVRGTGTHEWTFKAENKRQENTGQHTLLRASHGTRNQISTTAAVTIGPSSQPGGMAHKGTPDIELRENIPPFTGSANYINFDDGFTANFRTIMSQGHLSEVYTLRDLEERSAKKFTAFLKDPVRHAQWVQVFSAKFGKEGGPKELEKFTTRVNNWAAADQRYFLRYRIQESVRKGVQEIAALSKAISSGSHAMTKSTMKALSDSMHVLLTNEDSWVPTEIFSMEGKTSSKSKGINFGLQANVQDAVASDRELSFVSVPLQIAHDWTGLHRDPVHADDSPHSSAPTSPPFTPSPGHLTKSHSSGSSSFHSVKSTLSESEFDSGYESDGSVKSPPHAFAHTTEIPVVPVIVPHGVDAPKWEAFHAELMKVKVVPDDVKYDEQFSVESVDPSNMFATPATDGHNTVVKANGFSQNSFSLKPNAGGGDCLLHALEGKNLKHDEIVRLRHDLANERRKSHMAEKPAANALQIFTSLFQSPATQSQAQALMHGRHDISNHVYAAFQEIPGMYAGEDELTQWCALKNKHVAVVSHDGSLAVFSKSGRKVIPYDATNKAAVLKEALAHADIGLYKSDNHWQQIERVRHGR